MSALPHAAAQATPRLRALPARRALPAIVVAGTVLHALLARLLVTPSVFPDEYLYSQLARSLATTGTLRVRGTSAHFLPVLEPLLTAPLWLVHDVGTAYRLVQVENALVMSLAAVPAYLLARRLAVSHGAALAVATLAVAGPPFMFAGMILSEPFAYPLAICVVLLAVATVERPSPRLQLAFLAVAALTTLARLQLAVLPICVVLGIVTVGLVERRLRATLREQLFLVGPVAAVLVAAVAYAATRGFGYYHLAPGVTDAASAFRVAGLDVYVLALGAGIAIVPSASVGLALAVARPRSRGELAFGATTILFVVALVLQSVVWGDVHRVQERYLAYGLPLLAVAFALRRSRVDRRHLAEVGVAAAVAAVAALVPLSGTAIDAARGLAPVLYAFNRLQLALGSSANAAALFALGATALAAAGAIRRRTPVVATALVASLALLVAAASWSSGLARDARAKYLPADAHWVDHAAAGEKTMLVVGPAWRGMSLATLFWNPSVARVVQLPKATKVDLLNRPVLRVAADGRVDGLHGTVVTETSPLSSVALAGRRLGTWGPGTVWHTGGAVRMRAIVNNRLPDGRVRPRGNMQVWGSSSSLRGWVEVRVHAPRALRRVVFTLNGAGGARSRVVVPAGSTQTVRLPACGRGPWRGGFDAAPIAVGAGDWISALVSMPRFVPDARACT